MISCSGSKFRTCKSKILSVWWGRGGPVDPRIGLEMWTTNFLQNQILTTAGRLSDHEWEQMGEKVVWYSRIGAVLIESYLLLPITTFSLSIGFSPRRNLSLSTMTIEGVSSWRERESDLPTCIHLFTTPVPQHHAMKPLHKGRLNASSRHHATLGTQYIVTRTTLSVLCAT